MYIDAIFKHNGTEEVIKVVERVNGKRVYKEYPPDYHFFISDIRGSYKSIYDDPVKKIIPKSFSEKQKLTKQMSGNVKKWESDVDPVFRALEHYYQHVDAPTPNVAFFDIETSFDKETGWSEASEALNYITSISVYLQWLGKMVCLALPPESLPWDEAHKIGDEVTEKTRGTVILCKTEGEMLNIFMNLIEDADVLSGWNCIDLDEFIFLENRIKKLKNVEKFDNLGNNLVREKFYSGLKKKNIITTVFGKTLNMSDRHVIPYYSKDKESYKNVSSLKSTLSEGNIKSIKSLLDTNDIFIRQPIHKNNNQDLLWGTLCDNICIPENTNIDNDKIYFTKSKITKFISKNDVISLDMCRLLGFIFTDGHYSKFDSEFGFCGKYKELIDNISNILVNEGLCKSSRNRLAKDNCFYKRFSKNNKFLILSKMIFDDNWNKKLNTELLSLFSENQFISFLSGAIDGDGCIHDCHFEICNYNNNIKSLEILSTWNGFICTASENIIRYKHLDFLKSKFEKINLFHPIRKEKLLNLLYFEKKNSPNKILNWFHDKDNNELIVRINSIIETAELIEMGDIETDSHYFNCNGVIVHNSEAYDIPYIVNRIKRVLGKQETRRLCLWEQSPKERTFERGGKESKTYDLIGRIHVDYMQLYKKYNYEERHSYALNAIADAELGESKIAYEGTLDELYNDDFKKFLEYNIQDTRLLDRLDKKLQFIDLANSIAHANCVLIQTTMGAVAVTDQAVIIEAHNHNKICPNKQHDRDEKDSRAAGGWVATPRKGLHKWVAATDMKSLYPSVIRTLNMSPETIVGQIRLDRTNNEIEVYMTKGCKNTFAQWWNDRFNVLEMEDFYNEDIANKLTLDMEDGSSFDITGKELYDLIFSGQQPWCISANGTIFRTDKEGIIPMLLSRWYCERKTLQGIATNIAKINAGIDLPDGLEDL